MGFLSNLIKSYQSDDTAKQAPDASTAAGVSTSTGTELSRPEPSLSSQKSTSSTDPSSGSLSTSTAKKFPSALSTSLSTPSDLDTLYANPRARLIKQLSVYFAGTAFLGASIFVTRRAVRRKLITTPPKFYIPSNVHPPANGAIEAAEAFALATVNVTAFALMLTGGAMFALDVVSAEDLRRRYKAKMGFVDNAEQGADEEIEEWVRSVLGKKEEGDYKGVAEGLSALVGVLAGKEEDRERLQKMTADEKEKLAKEGEKMLQEGGSVLEKVKELVDSKAK